MELCDAIREEDGEGYYSVGSSSYQSSRIPEGKITH